MKIFVTGATGYIGFHVALALRRAGHDVLGLVRSEQKAKELARHEIRSVLGSMEKPDSYLDAASSCSVLVHAAAEWSARSADLDRTTVETLILAGNRGPQQKTFVYTSGVWVYGSTGEQAVDETAVLAPPNLVAWRPANEQRVLSAAGVRSVVVRPGCVYGKQGSLTSVWFANAVKDKSLKVVGGGSNHWTMVHVEDLADAYVRIVESGRFGEIFNVTDRSRDTVEEMVRAAARAAGYDGPIGFVPVQEAARSAGDYAECLAMDQHVDSRKAVRLLGWQPRFGGFVDGATMYYESWKALQA